MAVCSSATEALSKLDTEKPSLILTDIWMPEINGDEFAKRLRENPKYAELPVVAFTADTQLESRSNYFDDIIFKPINPKILNDTLGRFFIM